MLNEDDKRIERFERQAAEFSHHNLSVVAALNVPEGAENVIRTTAGGRPLTSAALSIAAKQLHLIQQGKKDKEQTHKRLIHQIEKLNRQLAEIRQEIKALEERNALLREQIDENNLNIAKETAKIAAANSLMERLESGESPESIKADSNYKKMAEAYRKETGKDPDKLDPKEILLWQINHSEAEIKGLNKDNKIKEQEIEENESKLVTLRELEAEYESRIKELPENQKSQAQTEFKNVNSQVDELREQNVKARNERVAIQSHEGVQDRAERESYEARRTENILTIDEEIGTFMKEYAKSQSIDNPMDRLRREKELVAGLSQNAQEQLSFGEDTERLFEENYFDALETENLAANREATPGPSLS